MAFGGSKASSQRAGRRLRLALVPLSLTAALVALEASAAPVVPVPGPLIKVHTESGGVVRDTVIPLGGVPVPLDVDGRSIAGVLTPDVDVSVGMIAAEELPAKPIVPTVEVRRNALAIARKTPAPPLRIDFTIEINDLNNGLRRIATVTYGYDTPDGGLAPTVFRSKLVGPLSGGFIDPLDAIVLSPGYSGPLTINAKVLTDTLDARFGVGLDPLPEQIQVVHDPRDDGFDFTYTHRGPLPDVELDLVADLLDRRDGRKRHVDAHVERLPQRIELKQTSTDLRTFVEYEASSVLAKPDLEASYRDVKGDGTLVVDANVKAGGLPSHMTGDIVYVPAPDGGREVDIADFDVLDGGQVDGLDFLARNYLGAAGPIPEPVLGPEQFVAVAARQMPDKSRRFRAAGRVRGVRSVRFERTGADNEGIDLDTDAGDGKKPLRAIVDVDNRGPGAPPDPKKTKHLFVDTTVRPLPQTVAVAYDLAKGEDPTHVVYDAGQTVDVDADVRIADAEDPADDDCGEAQVTCLRTSIDRLPAHLEATLPGESGTDFALSHNGNARPDVRAVVDSTPAKLDDRSWADVTLTGVPVEVRGRLDSKKDVVRAAEFHGCKTMTLGPCGAADSPGAIDGVSFTVRGHPVRTGLPPRPDTGSQFVSLLKRDSDFEVTGHVDDVRKIVFRQRDVDDNGEADGTLGALVAAGGSKRFQTVVDQLDTVVVGGPTAPFTGKASTKVDVTVPALPSTFSACVRQPSTAAPPDPTTLPSDGVLADCDRTDILRRGDGKTGNDPDGDKLKVTPLSAAYRADASTKLTGTVRLVAPDPADQSLGVPFDHVTSIDTTVDAIPSGVTRTDAIAPDRAAGRKLELAYTAPATIPMIDFALQSRRATSVCSDPRPDRLATCVSGRLEDLPGTVTATVDPDPSKGDIDITAPAASGNRLSINSDRSRAPLLLSMVAPDDPATTSKDESSRLLLDAHIDDITDHLQGTLRQLDDPFDGVSDPVLAHVAFDACPDPGVACSGIGSIDFTASNAAAGDPFANFPIPPAPTGVDQSFHFLQRGGELRAGGHIESFRQLSYTRIPSDTTSVTRTTTVKAGFGAGKALRAYVDRDTGTETQIIDGVLRDAARTVELCLRDKVDPSEVSTTPRAGFCRRAAARNLVVQATLDSAATGVKPDIELRKLEVGSGGGTQVLSGTATIEDLGERIDVLMGDAPAECADDVDNDGDGAKDTLDTDCASKSDDAENPSGTAVAEPPTVLVEGRKISDGSLDAAAGRVTFDLSNAPASFGSGFPYEPLDSATVEPERDPDNLDGGEHNYLKVISDKGPVLGTGVVYVNNLRFKGSIPQVKRVSLAPRPCVETDPRFPEVRHFTDATKRPEYLCVNAVAAQGRPLGLAIRTRDRDEGIVSVDDGLVSQLPTGDEGLLATITKTPETIKLSKVCATPADATSPGFCRPPLLSVQAKKGSGQGSPRLSGRLAIGPLELVRRVRDSVKPADLVSQRLDYEQRPRSYAAAGGRVKLGKDGDRVALRAGLNLDLPNYLDLDPPTSYRCARLIGVVLNDPCAADKERPGEWGTDYDKGLEAIDVFFKLVGADSAPGGSDLSSLGRVAMVYQDLASGGSQIVLTGAPPPDPRNLSADPPVPAGGSRFTPENPPPAGGAADLGALVPGHLDVQVFLRNDFDAPAPGTTQQRFVQVDGRINRPLTMAVRLNQPRCSPEITIPGFSFPKQCLAAGGVNRAGAAVPGAQFTVRNAPGLGGGVSDYTLPTFRVRAEIRGHKALSASGQRTFNFCTVVATIGCVYPPNSGDQSGLVNPPSQIAWLDVQLNLDPAGINEPARTVEAVFDPIQRTADADVRGFGTVYQSPGQRPAPAQFTPQLGMRLEPFNIYARLGIGDNWLRLYGDVVAHVASDGGRRLRLSQNAGKTGLVPDQGLNLLNVNIREILEDDPAIGRTLKQDLGRVGILLGQCTGPGVDLNGFAASSLEARGLTVLPSSIPLAFYRRQPLLAPTIGILPGLWCSGAVGPFQVGKFPLDDASLIGSNPAPRFSEPGRPVPGVPASASPSAPPPSSGPPPAPAPVVVSGTETFCGALLASTLIVTNGGRLEVGKAGTTITKTMGGDPVTIPCDGTLRIEAEDVDVQPGGVITASATRDEGPGEPPSAVGGGAGHFNPGGDSGRGDGGGPKYGSSSAIDFGDAGSPGGDGSQSGAGGLGGGLVSVEARNSITVDGVVAASGGRGDDAVGAGCSEAAAGGGSGGAIQLTAPRVAVGGGLEAEGGLGGDGAHGGGGGAGGKIAIDTTVRHTSGATFIVVGGSGGLAEPGCQPGTPGSNGTSALGRTQTRVATVRRAGTSTSRFVTTSTVNLDFSGFQATGGDFRFVYCRRSVGPRTANPFETPALDPPASATTVEDLLDDPDATCADLPGNPIAPGEYTASVADGGLTEGYHGYYVLAAEAKSAGVDCSQSSSAQLGMCDYSNVLPATTAVRVGVDTTGPRLVVSGPNGRSDCPGSTSTKPSLCISSRTGEVSLVVQDDMSGPAGASCAINRVAGGGFPLTCGGGRSTIPLGAGDGLKVLDVRIADAAGNSAVAAGAVEWFVDTTPPRKPVLTLLQSGTAINGWFRTKPGLKVDVTDDAPSSGFETDPLTLIVDGAQHRCGGTQTLPAAGSGATASCSATDTAGFVPSDGVHVFTGRAADRLGNPSEDGQTVTMRVDSQAPTSRLFLAPDAPDGNAGFYRTRPQVAFGASDGAGESGIDLRRRPPAGATENVLRYQLDGGTFTTWDPTHDITMPEGKHEICWYSVDVAANKEADGDPKAKAPSTNCRTVRVDSTTPVTNLSVTPSAPNGSAGWYTTAPKVDPQGSDPVPSGVPAADVSGLDRVEYQLDGGAWNLAATFHVGDGVREVRVRAFDKAGNAAVVAERMLRVDTTRPAVALLPYPPAPNDQGFYRQRRVESVAADDGRIGSGAASASWSVPGDAPLAYNGPFSLGHGDGDVSALAKDVAGLTSVTATRSTKIDLQAPVPRVDTPDPAPITQARQTTTLRFSVNGTLSTRAKVLVEIFDALGTFVHRIQAPGQHPGGFRDTGSGLVTWDGRGALGRPVLPGLYHYRVQAIDQAGNAAISSESRSFAVQAVL